MDNIYIKIEDLYEYKATYELFTKLFKNKDLVSIDDLIVKIEDLYAENEELKEQVEDLENAEDEIHDPYEYYGVSEDAFH